MTLYSLLMCVLNGISVRRATGYRQEVVHTFLLPLWASLIMGAAVGGIYYGISAVVPDGRLGNALGIAVSVTVGVLVYFVLSIQLGVMNKKELLGMPGGTKIVGLAVKMHLLKE